MADLFKDIINSILITKKNCLVDDEDYVPFIVNKALSFHRDCIEHANRMNMLRTCDKRLQYHYNLNIVRGYKRPFQKWHKRETSENLEAVKEYYKYSNEKAKDALKVLSNDDIMEIKKKIDKGGLNVKSQRTNRGDPSGTR